MRIQDVFGHFALGRKFSKPRNLMLSWFRRLDRNVLRLAMGGEMRTVAKICCFILLLAMTAHAEIEKLAQVCDTGICFCWWPKLPHLQ